jgi:hypothetical protein
VIKALSGAVFAPASVVSHSASTRSACRPGVALHPLAPIESLRLVSCDNKMPARHWPDLLQRNSSLALRSSLSQPI